jgi:hypothetical protein
MYRFIAGEMRRLSAWENIRHFRDRLWLEVDSDARARLRKLLINEEDKLGADLALLADIDRHISEGNHRIDRQRSLITAMERHGDNRLAQARTLLDCMLETQLLHQAYRRRILIEVEQNKL